MKNCQKILMFHSVGASENKEAGAELYSVEVEKFKEQMKILGTVPVIRPLISFDDGLVDNYTNAYPILKELGLKAYFFVIVSKIGTEGYMNWEQIRELKNAGMSIGSHGMTHRLLTELEDKELNDEIKESKMILEKNLGQRIDYFSIPFGSYNAKIIEKIKEAGYKAVFTSRFLDNDGFKIGRIAVKNNWDLKYFIRVINKGLPVRDRMKEFIKNVSKKILGQKNYARARTRILK